MSLLYNSNNIGAGLYNSASLDSLKYNETQVLNSFLELTWGDDFYLPLESHTNSTYRDDFGFTIRAEPNGRFDFITRVKPAVDDGTYSKPTFEQFKYEPTNGTTKNSLGSVLPYFVMRFPFDVYLQEIRIYDVCDRDANNATPPPGGFLSQRH